VARTVALLALLLFLGMAPYATAQKVPISFDDFHGYTGTVDYLKKAAAAYPNITELIEIGRSNKGRPMYVLVISNMSTGTTIDKHVPLRNPRSENVQNVPPMRPYQGKPGQWIDGGTHGNEFTGTEVCLYIIHKLLSGYGADPEITGIVDENAFYICPIVNPDGVYNSAEGGISQRQNSMMEDDDHDRKVNEDGPDDLNGDGLITQFRYKDPEGAYVQDERDAKVMIRLSRGEKTTRQRYSVIAEDKDNDGDGKRGEDSERGIDVNRNFPEGWFKDDESQGGSGSYPSSAPESRAVLEFFTNHTNILMTQSYHTSGGFTYRPFARWPDTRMDRKDLATFDRIMGRKYLELIGEEIPDVWKDQRPPDQARPAQAGPGMQARSSVRAAAAGPAPPRGWRHPYNDEQKQPYGYGIFIDWAYAQFGSWAMSTELWSWRRDTKGVPGFAAEDDRALWESACIVYQEKAGGKRFVPWQTFKHPELGEGEIGGWVSRYSPSNAIPGDTLRGVCDTHWQFELYKAKLLPRLRITDARARVLYSTESGSGSRVEQAGDAFRIQKGKGTGKYKLVQVTAAVENIGALATHVSRGAQLDGNRQDVIWLLGDRDKIHYLEGTPWMRLGVLEGTLEIPGYRPESGSGEASQSAPQQRFRPTMPGGPAMQRPQAETERVKGTGNKREVSWLVTIEGDAPLKVVVTSQKGGTQVKELTIN
jgi:hypothetical protein